VQTLGAPPGFFAQLVSVLVKSMRGAYPELAERQDEVVAIVQEEEAAFTALLQKGVRYFNDLRDELRQEKRTVISGDQAFFLYDSLGFPVDLTQIMAAEAGLTVDLPGFQAAMQAQQQRSRLAARQNRLGGRHELALGAEQTAHLQKAGIAATDDSEKYRWDAPLSASVRALYTADGFHDKLATSHSAADVETVGIVLEKTPFYAEAGGQAADSGMLTVQRQDGSQVVLDVVDVQVTLSLLHFMLRPKSP
jgi:alanyl-tRNA synthetase